MAEMAVRLFRAGFRLIHCPSWPSGGVLKSVTDDVMAQDLRDQLEQYEDIEIFVLATGDRNFIAVANALKRHGKKIYIAAEERSLSRELGQVADQLFILAPAEGTERLPSGYSSWRSERERDFRERERGRREPFRSYPPVSTPDSPLVVATELPPPFAAQTGFSDEEILQVVARLNANPGEAATLRRVVKALVPEDPSGRGEARSRVANQIAALVAANRLRIEKVRAFGAEVEALIPVDSPPAIVAPPAVEEPRAASSRRRRRRRGDRERSETSPLSLEAGAVDVLNEFDEALPVIEEEPVAPPIAEVEAPRESRRERIRRTRAEAAAARLASEMPTVGLTPAPPARRRAAPVPHVEPVESPAAPPTADSPAASVPATPTPTPASAAEPTPPTMEPPAARLAPTPRPSLRFEEFFPTSRPRPAPPAPEPPPPPVAEPVAAAAAPEASPPPKPATPDAPTPATQPALEAAPAPSTSPDREETSATLGEPPPPGEVATEVAPAEAAVPAPAAASRRGRGRRTASGPAEDTPPQAEASSPVDAAAPSTPRRRRASAPAANATMDHLATAETTPAAEEPVAGTPAPAPARSSGRRRKAADVAPPAGR